MDGRAPVIGRLKRGLPTSPIGACAVFHAGSAFDFANACNLGQKAASGHGGALTARVDGLESD